MIKVSEEVFVQLVEEAIDSIPEALRSEIENVEIIVQEWPTEEQIRQVSERRDIMLLGLYEGIPRTKRGVWYGQVLPDKITIFRQPLMQLSTDVDNLRARVRHTVIHEIAHHFGISDARLRELGAY